MRLLGMPYIECIEQEVLLQNRQSRTISDKPSFFPPLISRLSCVDVEEGRLSRAPLSSSQGRDYLAPLAPSFLPLTHTNFPGKEGRLHGTAHTGEGGILRRSHLPFQQLPHGCERYGSRGRLGDEVPDCHSMEEEQAKRRRQEEDCTAVILALRG